MKQQRRRTIFPTMAALLLGLAMALGTPTGKGGWLDRVPMHTDHGSSRSAPSGEKKQGGERFYLPAAAFAGQVKLDGAQPGTLPHGHRVGTPWTEEKVEKGPPHSLKGFLGHLDKLRNEREEAAAATEGEEAAEAGSASGANASAPADRETGPDAAKADSESRTPPSEAGAEQTSASGNTESTETVTALGSPIFPRPRTRQMLDDRIFLYFPVEVEGQRNLNLVIPGELEPWFRPPATGRMKSTATFRTEP
jgi:hypothetical protein